MFVAGASGYLNKGVNNNRDISNGTPFTYHSLQLDPTCPNYDNDRTKINSSKPGECIVLSTPPLSINVELHCGNPNDYAAASLVEKRIVIPILANVVKKITVAIRRLGSVQLKLYVHQCDFGCAFTYYKAQGKTMKLALACLNKPPENPQITYEALFVFLSRVKRQECCKILPLHNSHNYDHLKNLRPPMNLVAYLKAFDEGGNWCRERCKAALISARSQEDAHKNQKKQKCRDAKRTVQSPGETLTAPTCKTSTSVTVSTTFELTAQATSSSGPSPKSSRVPPKFNSHRSALAIFDNVVRRNGLKRTRQEPDGNCFFRSISFLLYGTAKHYREIRASVCELIDLRREHYQPFMTNEGVDDHLKSMRKNGTYADEIEIRGACYLFDLPLEIWCMHPLHGAVLQPETRRIPHNQKAIRLAYLNGNHYDSLMPIQNGDLQTTTNTTLLSSADIGVFETLKLSKIKTTTYVAESNEEVQLQIAKYMSILSYRAEIDYMAAQTCSVDSKVATPKKSVNQNIETSSHSSAQTSTPCKRKLIGDLCDETLTTSLTLQRESGMISGSLNISINTNSALRLNEVFETSLDEENTSKNDRFASAKRLHVSTSPTYAHDENKRTKRQRENSGDECTSDVREVESCTPIMEQEAISVEGTVTRTCQKRKREHRNSPEEAIDASTTKHAKVDDHEESDNYSTYDCENSSDDDINEEGMDENQHLYEFLVRPLTQEERRRAVAAWDCDEHSERIAATLPAGAGGSTVNILDKHIWRCPFFYFLN